MTEYALLVAAASGEATELVPWIPAFAGIVMALVGGVFALLNRKGGESARRQPTWVELVTENRMLRADMKAAAEELREARRAILDRDRLAGDLTDLRREFEEFTEDVEARDRVTLLVLASASEQWPADTAGPTFDHIVDLDVIHDTLPPAWRRRPRG